MGAVTARPYGQDGGVVQLPLAIEKILAGTSPYGADYSDSILGKEARVSGFWTPYGGNPILRHHAYLPGTHLLMLPFYLLSRALFGFFDPRLVTLLAYGAAIWLAAWCCPTDPAKRLTAAALVAVNPLVYWHQIFGANDVLLVALLLGAVFLALRDRPLLAAAVLGLACATKQLAWPFAPFLLVAFAGLRGFRDLTDAARLRQLAKVGGVLGAVFAVIVLPVAALDFKAFWGDIVVYNVGLPGGDNYPLGGTPGFGFANFLIYTVAVRSLRDYFPFGVFYLLLAPLGLLLLRRQFRENGTPAALVAGSIALLASLYFSRVVHPNYLILAAILVPLGLLMGLRVRPDAAVVPLLLFAVAVEVVEQEIFRTTWEDSAGLAIGRVFGWFSAFGPRAAPGLTNDPIGLVIGAVAAGLGLAYLVVAFVGDNPKFGVRARMGLIAVAFVLLVAAPAALVIRVGTMTGRARVQDPWMARALAGPDRSPATAPLEAWSQSFRRDPPSPVAQRPRSASAATLAGWLVPLGVDARWLSVVALALSGYLVARRTVAEQKPALLGVVLLSAPAVIGGCFGSPDPLILPLLLAALAARRVVLAFGVGVTLLTVPGLWHLGSEVLDPGPPTPGVGWGNVLAYWGLEDKAGSAAILVALVGVATSGWLFWRAHTRRQREGEAGLGEVIAANLPGWLAAVLLLEMFFGIRESSPHEMLIPLVLLALAVDMGRR